MINDKRYYLTALALSICVLVETLSMTYMQQKGGTFYYSSSILFFLCGLAVCILPFISIKNEHQSSSPTTLIDKLIPFLSIGFIMFVVVHHVIRLEDVYTKMLVSLKWADMIPTIQIACARFLHGETVYAPVPQLYEGSIMPYLPMMWMPFLPAAIFHFDFRWVTVFFQLLGIAIIMTPLMKIRRGSHVFPTIMAGAGLFLFLNYFLYKRYDYWGMTEEGVVVCFYLLLGFALLRKNYWLIGLAITGCTLSRYSLIMWLPVYLVFVMMTRPRADFWKLLVSSGASMLALFVIPFFIRDPVYFIHIPDSYMILTKHFWEVCGIADHKFYNVGLFKFFSFEAVHIMFVLELATSFLAPVLLILAVKWVGKRTEVNERYLAFASLKISLIFFFAFIQIPYVYVFVPLALLSYVLLFDYLARPDLTYKNHE